MNETTKFILTMLAVSVGFNLFGFLIAYFRKTDKVTDFFYALTFAFLAVFGFFSSQNFNSANFLLMIMVLVWALRLGSYLVIRINKWGRDKRFDQMRENFWEFLRFWAIQALTVWVVSINFLLFFELNKSSQLEVANYLGLILFVIFMSIEAVADIQKFNFISNPKNKGKFINLGLWKTNRHPNYFGEIGSWLAVYIFSLSALSGQNALIGLISPLFIFLMITFISGIPILEKQADKRWGDDPKYKKYKQNAGILWFKI